MAQLVYSTINSGYSSTQAWLGSVLTCPSCKGQKPKELFKVVDGESICKDCQEDFLAEQE
jgi:hypothetical protein